LELVRVYLAAEPNAVRIRLETPLINPLIQLVKYTNGEDANTPTGPLIEIGDPVTWTYVITNIGNTRLANITLTDDIEGVIQDATTAICAEGRIPSLEPDDTFTCTVTGVATAGQYANIGTVTGDPTVPGDPGDTPIEDPTNPGNPMPPVDDDDPSHYYGFDPNLARLGDLVWIDNNANGVQDPGEPGLGGITVNLYDMTDPANPVYLDTTTTDSTGFYNFVDLQPGDYQVEFVLPPMYSFTTQDAGGNDAADSDADPTTGLSHIVTLGAGEYDPTIDAGVISVASIGDFVWYDTNGDGIQDPGEPGAVGITVHLLDENNNIIDTTVTDADGYYGFIDLPPGTYSIRVERPTGYTFSPRDQGANDGVDSDADLNGDMDQTTLLPGQHDPNWDAGLVQVSALGDYVWYDMNNNGIQDAGEAPVPGVTVRLLDAAGNPVVDASGTPVAPQTTAADGSYLFTNLIPGQYIVEFELPPGNVFSPQNQGANDAVDSDADPTTGRTSVITLPPGVTDRTWDAGIVPLASIGDRVWEDQDGDGIQDPGEPGIPNVTVILYDDNGDEVDRTTTDPNGNYIFEDLPPGDYSLEFVPPPGYVISPPDQGGNDAVDSDADPTTGRTVVTTLDPGENDMTWDAGLSPLSSLGDYVWRDNNGDGIQDAGEPPVRGVTVILYDGNNVEVARTTTDANGYYIFEGLRAGDYVVEFVPPAGYEFSPQGQGGDTALDSNADTTTGRTSTIALGWGEHNPTIDAGIVPLGSIGDRVWLDYNEDGHQDPNEPGIPNVVVNLYDGNNVLIDSTRTNGNGEYLFTNLPAGTYTVEVDLTTLPPDLRATFDWDGNLDSVTTVTLGIGEHIRYVDFGYVPPFVPGDGDWKPEPTPTPIVTPTPTPVRIDGTWGARSLPPVDAPEWESLNACEFMCVDWQLYHSNRTGDWEIFRLGDHHSGMSISENLSQGEGFDDISPTRSPNAEWIVFASNRDGNWELYVAATNGDSSKTQRLTYNEVAIDTNPVWGPNNYVVYETTRNGNWDLYLLDMSTGRSEQLTTHSGSDINAFWSPDGTKIVFQSDRSGQWQIYELDLRTNIVTLLSDGQGVDVDPQYNNAGTQIAFRSYRDGRENSVIYTANANGEGVQAISDLNGDATNHAWSPDDTLIAYQSEIDNSLDIYVYQLGSRATRQVTDDVDVNNYAPTWKCGSNELLFTSEDTGNPDIFTVNALPITAPAVVIEEEAEQLTFDVADDIYPQGAPVKELASREGQVPNANQALGEQTSFLQPDVSVTDRDISVELGEAFEPLNSCVTVCQSWTLYHSDQPGNWDIFRLDQGSNSPINISRASDATDFSPTRSPNGEWVAFVSDRDGNKEIYVAGADGTNHRRVTYNEANDTIPVWSPNSQYLVYESDRNGNWDLFLFDLSTGKETQLTQGSSDDVNATWSSAGGRIVFQSNRDGRWQLYALTLRDMATTRLTDQAENTIEPSYSVNGSYIAFRVVNSDGKTVLHIMEEDGSDLRAISDPDGSASNHSWYFDDTLLAYQSDLDGDLDIYVYDVANDLTRQVTQNDVPDYAPTWICGEPMVIFTSTVSGSPDIFETNAQPMDAPPVSVDSGANQLTFGNDQNQFPVGMPSQENASRSLND
jgi:Tol biopolymer transport system component/protocatechuate 3,4-dioxygenase beta subunit